MLSLSFLLSLSSMCFQATFCTWISRPFINIIPSLLSKLSSDVFLPLRLRSLCLPALSATTLSLDLFVLTLYIWIELSSWGRDPASYAFVKGCFHVQECRTRRIQAKKKIFSNSVLKFQLQFYCWIGKLKLPFKIYRCDLQKPKNPSGSAIRKWKKIAFHKCVMVCKDLDTGMNS